MEKKIIASRYGARQVAGNNTTIGSEINPTDSVIPIKNGLIYKFLLIGIKQRAGLE
ncbi:hypothetical protein [Pedobacter sp. KACC 23697]|uniref:Uncharacterized protein n=1 Tax=Pedobacter sp. KACC 23697 TaxID=3149230 RepID=A0AAU7K1F5_9SPHI